MVKLSSLMKAENNFDPNAFSAVLIDDNYSQASFLLRKYYLKIELKT